SCALSRAGIRTEVDFSGRSLKALMKRADRLQAGFVLIAGDQELERGAVLLRNMEDRQQREIAVDKLVEGVRAQLRQKTKGNHTQQ
ncbi:MAG TPA: His/Gly/Thr/Pro-type tRNA ligase C-terminal domain-containing protein, partial [Desulfosalsimonadaceae bacterium]|nr:His/Gly/Thr/Pro-type tRNA ligase C-terminal domain-containing protein [Desulfosalsimonadaceae bacterium]